MSGLLRSRVDSLVPCDPHVRRDPVDAGSEGGASTEEAAEEGVEGAEEILARLGFGGGERDYGGLAVRENVDAREPGGPFDDVEGQDGAGDFGLKNCVLARGPQVLCSACCLLFPVPRYRGRSYTLPTPPSKPDPSVYTQKPPLLDTSSISFRAASFVGAMLVERDPAGAGATTRNGSIVS